MTRNNWGAGRGGGLENPNYCNNLMNKNPNLCLCNFLLAKYDLQTKLLNKSAVFLPRNLNQSLIYHRMFYYDYLCNYLRLYNLYFVNYT